MLWTSATPPVGPGVETAAAPDPTRPDLRAVRFAAPTPVATALPSRPAVRIQTPHVALDRPFEDAGSFVLAVAAAPPPPGVVGESATESDATDGTLPPIPRAILSNWVVPRSAQGRAMTVRVWVTSVGRAVGPVELDPPTPDGRFNRRVAERVRRIPYRPAQRNGESVGGWAEITFVFCPTTVTATSPPVQGEMDGPICDRRTTTLGTG